MTIRYLSFDFDGCLFNKAYVQLPHDNFSKHKTDAVLVNNKAFLEKLKKQNSKFSAVYGFIGSTRQDYNTDLLNCGFSERFKGSCCSAMEIICDYLGITLDPFMLADAEGQLQSGTSFQRIMDEIKNNSWMDMKKIFINTRHVQQWMNIKEPFFLHKCKKPRQIIQEKK